MTSTETTRFCPMCAAAMRPRAVFCHRCGKPYPEEMAVIYDAKNSSVEVPNTAEFESEWNKLTSNGDYSQEPDKIKATEPLSPETSDANENADAVGKAEEAAVEAENKTPNEPEKKETKQRVKRRVVQTTEYVWEEPSTDPTWRFALATVIILIFAFFALWFGGFINF